MYEDIGHPLGWPGIEQYMGPNLDIVSDTGFEKENSRDAGIKPYEWFYGNHLWWDPIGDIPKGYYF